MMQTISFSYLDCHERERREQQRLQEQHMGYTSTAALHVPRTDYSDIEENSRTYVFPACGHVHGYHQSLVGKPCPLCRQPGPYVPLAFEFDSAFSTTKPTNVLNPCGHAASRDVCEEFASIACFVYDIHGNVLDHRARCPFCCIELQDYEENGGPFNRLILQSESGALLENESEKSDASSDAELSMMNSDHSQRQASYRLLMDNSNSTGSNDEKSCKIVCDIPMHH
jgi:hypothetical protein